MIPDGFYIGTFKIYFYALIILSGALMAAWLASVRARKRGLDSDLIWDMLPWLLIAGIVGARIWHILTPPASMVEQGITTYYYLTHPLDMLKIRNGGLGIPGAVIGGAIALYVYARRHKISFPVFVDIIAPGLALAQAVGRWGNFFNQEVYGAPTDLPWKLFISPAHRLPEYADVAYYHPLFFYEFLYNLLNMGILLWIGKRFANRLKDGDIFLTYLIIYPVGRFFLEFLRLDPSPIAGINANQTLMAVIAVGAAIALILRHRFGARTAAVAEAGEVPDESSEPEPGADHSSSENEGPDSSDLKA
ncbi:prolipoprotein diacylglyceryl transferase [Longilinea arvoryzae]|uniref:Phosphatidylglycerol--prolipoprotein diacylglyceryl transferase n=1 Tax=Longilinea arvoryzae TaxID=360412 RepID=A0A0S7BKH6_9CHLR|nr:prolipoprotein diacylglyceryl transferase [Longilinea arvoryzae]GAP15139.1 prolipoprotein diacylglyceryl transferase [Longilinea arvoryzae]